MHDVPRSRQPKTLESTGARPVANDLESQTRDISRGTPHGVDHDLNAVPRLEAAGESDDEVPRPSAAMDGKPLRRNAVPHHLDLPCIDSVPNKRIRERDRDGEDPIRRAVGVRLGLHGQLGMRERSESELLVSERRVHLEEVGNSQCRCDACAGPAVERVALVDGLRLVLLREAQELVGLSLGRRVKRRLPNVVTRDHRWKLDEIDTDFEAVPLRADPRGGDRDSSALRAEGGNEFPYVDGRPLVSEDRHAGIGADVEQTHQAAVHCFARVPTRSTLLGMSPAPASAA